jgi:hypothetical protein
MEQHHLTAAVQPKLVDEDEEGTERAGEGIKF